VEECAVLESTLRGRAIDAVVWQVSDAACEAQSIVAKIRDIQTDPTILIVGPDCGAEVAAGILRGGAYDYLTEPLRAGRLEDALVQGLDVRESYFQVRRLSEQLTQANKDLAHERDSLARWNRNLVGLNHLGQAIAGTLDMEEIVHTVRLRLGEILSYDIMGVAWFQSKRVWVSAGEQSPVGDVEPMRRQLLETITRVQSSEWVPESESQPCLGVCGNKAPEQEGAQGSLCLPLMVADCAMGVLCLARGLHTPFESQELELLKTVATSFALALRNAEAHGEAQSLAVTDSLTNLLNRRAFSNILLREVRATERYRTPVCLIMVDIDHFKLVNDRYGHVAGDRALKELGDLLKASIRSVDVATRYGGEEFAIILPRTDLSQAAILANRIRDRVERTIFCHADGGIRLSISMGIARIPHVKLSTVEEFVGMADTALYAAKQAGRNRVVLASELDDEHGVASSPSIAVGAGEALEPALAVREAKRSTIIRER
jgi:diguanylate cyclase (GGDEF)-like protein